MDDHPLADVGMVAADVKTFVVKVAAGVTAVTVAAAVVDAEYYVAAAIAESIEFDFAGQRTYDAVVFAVVDDEDAVIVVGAAAVL